jgi:hypothetical protein
VALPTGHDIAAIPAAAAPTSLSCRKTSLTIIFNFLKAGEVARDARD